jgi:hypothetical protein
MTNTLIPAPDSLELPAALRLADPDEPRRAAPEDAADADDDLADDDDDDDFEDEEDDEDETDEAEDADESAS